MKTIFDPRRPVSPWRVTYQQSGKQARRWFKTREEADRFAANRAAELRAYGTQVAAWTARERLEIIVSLERLRRLGWTLRGAVDFVESHGQAPPAASLETVARAFLLAKQAAGNRPRYLRTLRASLERFLSGRREKPIAEISTGQIRDYITRNGWRPATARSYLTDVQSLFAWAVRNKYLRDNPALAVERPRLEDRPPGILTPRQCADLLRVCRDAEPTLLPTLALCLLAGVRPDEARRLEWANVLPDHVEIPGAKAKTRRRRLVPTTPQLRAWLDLGRAAGGELPVRNFPNKFNRIRRLAGVFADWPHDALRHSFASYHFAKHRNETDLAAIMGNSPQMIFAHYREVVRPADAEKFFGLLPGTLAPAPLAVAAPQQPKPGKVRAVSRPVSIAILGEVFAQGTRALTRPAAVSLLCDRHGYAPSTAHAALSATGRFRAHLREAEGVLHWNPFPGEAAPPGEPALKLSPLSAPALASAENSEAGPVSPLPGPVESSAAVAA